jgi:hypothetical protein
MMSDLTALWTRLDTAGDDACRLNRDGTEWHLSGSAVFASDGLPTSLQYHLTCDSHWRTTDGAVSGWSGSRLIAARFSRTSGGTWTMNGHMIDSLAECVDLDFGFTPATNVVQLRRLSLAIGERVTVSVAWFDFETAALQRLPQSYQRLSDDRYAYEAPSVGYAAELEVGSSGIVKRYPRLWEQVA